MNWAARCTYRGPYAKLVRRSLLTLKALTYAPTGGIVAAPSTALPEKPGGVVDNYALQGRTAEATALFERLAAVANDVGLLAEEYDPGPRLLLGNFPQAFSHVSLINAALTLASRGGPIEHRQE